VFPANVSRTDSHFVGSAVLIEHTAADSYDIRSSRLCASCWDYVECPTANMMSSKISLTSEALAVWSTDHGRP